MEVVCYSDRLLSVCIIGHPKCHLTRVECWLLIIVDVGTIAPSYSFQVSVYLQIACKGGGGGGGGGQPIIIIILFGIHTWLTDSVAV